MLSSVSSDSKTARSEKNIGIKSILIEWKDRKTTTLHYFVNNSNKAQKIETTKKKTLRVQVTIKLQ